jgi:ketosteroid isomerase-like protein
MAPAVLPVLSDTQLDSLRREVEDSERAFARSMALRDLSAFGQFVSEEAVFLSGNAADPSPAGRRTLRGRSEVLKAWAPLFVAPVAPFSWEPDRVELLASGALALSTGPVRDPAGRVVARFSSIWRLESPGLWRVVFDQGADVCERP